MTQTDAPSEQTATETKKNETPRSLKPIFGLVGQFAGLVEIVAVASFVDGQKSKDVLITLGLCAVLAPLLYIRHALFIYRSPSKLLGRVLISSLLLMPFVGGGVVFFYYGGFGTGGNQAPEGPSTTPADQPGASLSQPGTSPGQLGTVRQPEMSPGQLGTVPRQPETSPGQLGTVPRQPETSPGQPATAPRQPGTSPGQPGAAPSPEEDDSTNQAPITPAPKPPIFSGPKVVIKNPAKDQEVGRAAGAFVTGTASNLGGKSLWLFDQSDSPRPSGGSAYYLASDSLIVENGEFATQDAPIGSEGAQIEVVYITAVLADKNCENEISGLQAKSENERYFQDVLPLGCEKLDSVRVVKNRP